MPRRFRPRVAAAALLALVPLLPGSLAGGHDTPQPVDVSLGAGVDFAVAPRMFETVSGPAYGSGDFDANGTARLFLPNGSYGYRITFVDGSEPLVVECAAQNATACLVVKGPTRFIHGGAAPEGDDDTRDAPGAHPLLAAGLVALAAAALRRRR